jgi:putative tricarboxylic transport membrane protein
MEALFSNLWLGFGVALTVQNLSFALLGALIGTAIGVLPGIGPTATISLLLPITFGMSATSAVIMLSGIYYGAQYGGSTTAILLNIPGEVSSVATTLEGYKMARKGRAGAALTAAALSSFFAGTVATIFVAAAGPLLTKVALSFAAEDYFSLMLLGLIISAVLAQGSVLKSVSMVAFGVSLGVIGTDGQTGIQRFTFGIPELSDGIGFIAIAMGMFGITEIMLNLERPEHRDVMSQKVGSLYLTREETRRSAAPTLRGTALGSILGLLPGGGAALASFASYMLERKISKYRNEFGSGAIEGVAGPESANNAAAQTSFIPMLTLGIPANAVMSLMIGALILQGIQPGPQMLQQQPSLFWGLIASMWVGNLMLLVINLPLIGIWVKLLAVPYRYLYPAILIFCLIGVYSINNNVFDVYTTMLFAVVGYLCAKLGLEPAPLLLGYILGPMMEEHLRRALLLGHGDPSVFFTSPISAVLLAVAAIALGAFTLPSLRKKKEAALST